MQLEEIKIENKEELTQKENLDLFRSIVMGKEVTEIIETERGNFKIKYPRARDIEEIGRKTAWRLNGIPVRCFDANTYNLINYVATLDVITIEGPDWWKLAQKENPNFGWADIPDQDYILEVYAKAYKFRSEVQEQIRSNKKSGNSNMAALSGSSDTTEPGTFEGMSGSSDFNG